MYREDITVKRRCIEVGQGNPLFGDYQLAGGWRVLYLGSAPTMEVAKKGIEDS